MVSNGTFVDDDYSSILDRMVAIGDLTRFIGNAKPELHDVVSLSINLTLKKCVTT